MSTKSRGLGDDIQKITKSTGIEKIVKNLFGDDCGCKERIDRLNKMFPNRPVKQMNEKQKEFFEQEVIQKYKSGQNLTKHIGKAFYDLYEDIFSKKKKITKCTSCNKSMYIELMKVYESSCNE